MKWIHQQPGWPQFHWDAAALGNALAQVRYQQGHLLGRMQALGFELRQEASLNTLTNDGNGRIARAIADMALTRADASPQRFYSMSAQIEAERKAYYNQLERQQRGSLDVTPWLGWFLECLGRALGSVETALESALHKAWVWECANRYRINERQRLVLNRMLDDFQGYRTYALTAAATL